MVRALLGGMLVGLAIVLAGCGGGDDGAGGDTLAETLSYLPEDASGVVVIDTDLDGDPIKALEKAIGPEVLGAPTLKKALLVGDPSADERELLEKFLSLVGDELVLGAPYLGALSLVAEDHGDDQFVAAMHVRDTDALRDVLESLELRRSERDGVEYWGNLEAVGEITAAIDGDNLVVATYPDDLEEALRTHDGPEHAQFRPEQLDAAAAGLGEDAPVRVYLNAGRLVRALGATKYEDIPWNAALETAAATIRGDGDTIAVDAAINTDPSALTDDDLPLPPGSPTLQLTSDPTAINGANANQSRLTTYLLDVLRKARPDGRFAQDVATVERERGIDFDEEVLRQFDGPSASTVMPGGRFAARSTVRDPERMEKTLELIAPDLGRIAQDLDPLRELGLTALLLFAPDAPVGPSVLGDADIRVEKIHGGRALYRMSNLNRPEVDGPTGPDEIVLGLVGDVFVVGDSLTSAKEIADADLAPVQGLTGAATAQARITGELREALSGALMPDVGDRELMMSATASRERLRASVRLAPLQP